MPYSLATAYSSVKLITARKQKCYCLKKVKMGQEAPFKENSGE